MLEHNAEITWIPEHIRDGQFGRWIANRANGPSHGTGFWGPDPRLGVFESQLRTDRCLWLHRGPRTRFREEGAGPSSPFVDELVRTCPDCGTGTSAPHGGRAGLLVRVRLPCPTPRCIIRSTTGVVREEFPADIIVEYIAQTRGMVLYRSPCFPPVFSTSPRSATASATASCSTRTARSYPEAPELPPARRCVDSPVPTRSPGSS